MIHRQPTQWVAFFLMLIILMTHQSTSVDWTLASAQLPDGSGTTCAAYIWHNDVLYFYGGIAGDNPFSDPFNWVENGYKWDPVNDISTFTPFPQPPPTTLKTCSWGSPKAAVIGDIMYIYNDLTPELVQFDLASFDWISGTISVPDADNQADLGFKGCMVSDGTYLYVIGAYLVPHIRRYHPSTTTWLSSNGGGMSAYMPGPCLSMQCSYHNNKIYHFGCRSSIITNTIYIYDISSDTWSLSAETLVEGVIHTPDIVDHTNQKAYIIGGSTTTGYDNQYKVQIYDIPSNTISWDSNSDLPVSLSKPMGGFVGNTIYLLGGVSYQTATDGTYYATIPTAAPTDIPTVSPSHHPTDAPTIPSARPSITPSDVPTAPPSSTPSDIPTYSPSRTPTYAPITDAPSRTPTVVPTFAPSRTPTDVPTISPSRIPSNIPTASPSRSPTDVPTGATPSPTDAPSRTPTDVPTISPSLIPSNIPTPSPNHEPTEKYIAGETTTFKGYELFVRGYNIWKMTTAGNTLLDINWADANIEGWTQEGAECSLSSLEFGASFSSYSEYAESSSANIETGFNAGAGKAGGSLSKERTETKSHSASSQSYIYSLDLECSYLVASLNSLNKLHWSANFLNNLRVLPDSFDSSDITAWTDFWDSFGTHLIKTAKLGGRVTGAITVDKCEVEESYSDSDSYEACLNAEYAGVEGSGCSGESTESKSGQGAQNAIKNTRIVVKGGSTSQFTDVFNSFSDKTDNFQSWIDGLSDHPDVIGGNLDEIHDAVRNVIALGSHNFNDVSDVDLTNEEWVAKANVLEEAYNYYSGTLINYDTISEASCKLDCDEGTLDTAKCQCDECSDGGQCCGIEANGCMNAYELMQVSQSMVLVLACFAIWIAI
eukprot:53692_1